jgi:CRP-like cAMP-binding protein
MQSLITVNSHAQEHEASLELAQREQLSKLLTKSNFFRELAPSVQSKLPEIAQCASKPKGTVVFRQGDTGLHCYVVLSGKVGVWIAASNSTKEEEDEIEEISIEAHSSRSLNSASSSISTAASETPCAPSDSSESSFNRLGTEEGTAPFAVTCRPTASTVSCSKALTSASANRTGTKLKLDHFRAKYHCETDFGSQVATLGPGSIFGELALLHEQPRNATVTCSDDCELIIIKKNDFNALLKEEVERAKTEKFNFLQAYCPGCKKLSALRTRKIDAVMYAFDKITVPKGHVFLKQDNACPVGVYLVSSGSVELRSTTKGTLTTPIYKPKTCSFGVLLKGAAFGCPFTGRARKFQCSGDICM